MQISSFQEADDDILKIFVHFGAQFVLYDADDLIILLYADDYLSNSIDFSSIGGNLKRLNHCEDVLSVGLELQWLVDAVD